ncbi:MAG: hypothetical protein ACK55Z_12985, partial [bacterium]
ILTTSQIIEKSVTQDQIVKTYSNHPELLKPGETNKQARIDIKKHYTPLEEDEIMNNNIQNDQPPLDQTQQQLQQQTVQNLTELHPGDDAIQTRNSVLNRSEPSAPEETGTINNQPQLTTQANQPTTTHRPTTTNRPTTMNILQLLDQATNPPHIQVLVRKKRHWLSQAFSDLTALATQTDLNIL